MAALQIRVDRIDVELAGVSAATARQAVGGLETSLGQRLQGRALDSTHDVWLPELTVGPVAVDGRVDANALRVLLAERVEAALVRAMATGADARTGGR